MIETQESLIGIHYSDACGAKGYVMMPDEQTIGDRTRIGTVAEVTRMLLAMHQHFRTVCEWITTHVERTERNLTLYNILSAASTYLPVAAHNIEAHLSVLALATRSLYELNLRSRHVLESDDNMRLWHAEAVTDKIQLLEGILQLQSSGEYSRQHAILRSEIDRLKDLVTHYKLPNLKRAPNVASISESVGQAGEHKALFKLFSKIVHPSSYLVNDYSNAASPEVAMILQIHAQLYAWDTFSRICNALSVPGELQSFSGKSPSGGA